MPPPACNCPNCGAPVTFRFSSAVQTTCPYCHSILVRHDLDLTRVGQVADLPPDPSPIQLLTEGVFRGSAFVVVGRILYEYSQGFWNEWHCVTHQGESCWLSDAMAQYAITRLLTPSPPLPPAAELYPGMELRLGEQDFTVTTLTRARYLGVEGELPFAYWGRETLTFADLRTPGERFATIDYSEEPPLVFLGDWADFDSLQLKNLKQFPGW